MATKEKLRSEIEEKYKWDLTTIYKNEDDFKSDLAKAKKEICKVTCYKDKFLKSSKDFLEFMTYDEKIDVAVYFVMDHDNTILNNKNFKRLFPNKNIVNRKGDFEDIATLNIFKYNSISKWLDGIRKCEYLVTFSISKEYQKFIIMSILYSYISKFFM